LLIKAFKIALLTVTAFLVISLPVSAKETTELAHFNKYEIQPLKPIKANESHQPRQEAKPVVVKKPAMASPSGSKQDWLKQAGIPESDWGSVEFIISHESAWRPHAVNPSSGATGLCQALPAQKMQSAGSDYMTNPVTQLKWCHSYALARYGSWQNAVGFWQEHKWW
jgi:hypothetical protein